MQSKLQKILKKMKNQTEIENIQELKKKIGNAVKRNKMKK